MSLGIFSCSCLPLNFVLIIKKEAAISRDIHNRLKTCLFSLIITLFLRLFTQNFVGQPLPARLAASSVSAKYLHLNDAVYFFILSLYSLQELIVYTATHDIAMMPITSLVYFVSHTLLLYFALFVTTQVKVIVCHKEVFYLILL